MLILYQSSQQSYKLYDIFDVILQNKHLRKIDSLNMEVDQLSWGLIEPHSSGAERKL